MIFSVPGTFWSVMPNVWKMTSSCSSWSWKDASAASEADSSGATLLTYLQSPGHWVLVDGPREG